MKGKMSLSGMHTKDCDIARSNKQQARDAMNYLFLNLDTQFLESKKRGERLNQSTWNAWVCADTCASETT